MKLVHRTINTSMFFVQHTLSSPHAYHEFMYNFEPNVLNVLRPIHNLCSYNWLWKKFVK
jgi:hypothetical protein